MLTSGTKSSLQCEGQTASHTNIVFCKYRVSIPLRIFVSHCYDYLLIRDFSPKTNMFADIRTEVCMAHCKRLEPQLESQGLDSTTYGRCNAPPTLWQNSKY